MSSFVDQTYSYEGKDAVAWYTKAILGAPTLELISVHPKVKNSVNVPSLNISRSIGAASCAFTPTGDITVGTKKLTVTEVSVQKSICESDIVPLFLSSMMKDGTGNEDFLPETLVKYMLDVQASHILKEVEEMIWQGDTAGGAGNHLDEIDGLIKQMLADAAVIDVANVVLTAANITTEISKVVAAIPKPMKKKKKEEFVGIGMSSTAAEFYRAAISAGSPVNFYNLDDDIVLKFNGWKIFVIDGLLDDQMVFADYKNLWFGTDLQDEITAINVIPMAKTTGDKQVRLVGGFKLGVSYGNGSEIVLYS